MNDFDLDLYNRPKINVNMPIEIQYWAFNLIVAVMFDIYVTVYEIHSQN